VKLWHDDVRPAPDGWVWARTNDEALKYLRTGEVEEISLDHDLGCPYTEEEIMADVELAWYRGTSNETGLDLCRAMVRENLVPERVRIHSWNPPGAEAMAKVLTGSGHDCEVRPFSLELEGKW